MVELILSAVWSWMEQAFLIAALGSLLPVVLRLKHPRTELAYCHLLLILCLALPLIEPWRHPVVTVAPLPESNSKIEPPEVVARPAGPVADSGQPVVDLHLSAPHALRKARVLLPWSRIILGTLITGAALRLAWLFAGLIRIRRYRIAAMPLYPTPEPVRAASAITHTDALFCISREAPGPVMLGWLAPVVLLPELFLELREEAQCAIACHELIHVRRHDWPITLLEELAAAILWFNPAIWLLLARTRLVREQLVDSETVRLTAARESYIEVLLAIARGGPVSDLAPAPLFLRRRHLTQRMQALIKETTMSKPRLLSSYGSIGAILGVAGWFGFMAFPLVGPATVHASVPVQALLRPAPPVRSTPAAQRQQPEPMQLAYQSPEPRIPRVNPQNGVVDSVPVPSDPHEPVTGSIQVPETAADRAAALSLFERALQNSKMHMPQMKNYHLAVSFTASGNAAVTGTGGLDEIWLSGQSWRWTATLGNFSIARIGSRGVTADENPVATIPMRVQMLRGAIFWAARGALSNAAIRTAAVDLNGKPATCILSSGMNGAISNTRLWEEEEYCIDNASGLLQMYSVAPGTYIVYGYGKNIQFHGRFIPDQITAYIGGVTALAAQVNMTDAGTVDPSLVTVTPQMLANGPAVVLATDLRIATNVVEGASVGLIHPVIVHAIIDPAGKVVDEELSAASDPSLAQPALNLVKNTSFSPTRNQRDIYINVRYGAPQ